jgi:deoxyribodipyrimidine photo-lyase
MGRDQRKADNWALLHAAEQAQRRGERLAVCFTFLGTFLGAGARQFGFMLRGLRELAPRLEAAHIRFHLLEGMPPETVPQLARDIGASLLVTDQWPLRLPRQWRQELMATLDIPFHEVDAHNVVPVRRRLKHV